MIRQSVVAKRLREMRGDLSQKEFAEKIGIPYRTYQRYESGGVVPKIAILNKISLKYKIPVEELLGDKYRALLCEEDFSRLLSLINIKTYEKMPITILDDDFDERLLRIIKENDSAKIKAIRAQLEALDPDRD